ncbi:MAG: glycosyl hydrolase 53 family protein [Eubacterium sp.]
MNSNFVKFSKKIVATSLCATMIFGLVGCNGGGDDKKVVDYGDPVEAGVCVEKVEGLNEDFVCGIDISSLIAEEESGVVYYDKDGNEEDLLKILADSGINYVRARVWNDPYLHIADCVDREGITMDSATGTVTWFTDDEEKHMTEPDLVGYYNPSADDTDYVYADEEMTIPLGYGGGNCTIDTAIEIGKRATANGIKMIVDFHYSDFWADPNKQFAPKEWEDYSVSEKCDAIYEYTKDSLKKLSDAGVDVGIVSIGNETNGEFCGEINWIDIAEMMNSASKAIREADKDIKVALHFANPEKASAYENYLAILDNWEVDYDIFASSYYPYWHGTLDNLTKILSYAKENYNKEVMVMETSYAYSGQDYDGWTNTSGDGATIVKNYSFTVQGQCNAIHDVIQAVVDAGGMGVCYWEGAWIPVPDDTESGGLSRAEKWKNYGSGWASIGAVSYDPEDSGTWYGGNAVDNNALFDAEGNVLESINIWSYCKTGTVCDKAIDEVCNTATTIRIGDEIVLPETTTVIYNDREEKQFPVVWNDLSDAAINTMQNSGPKTYTVKGLVDDGSEEGVWITCEVNMVEPNYVEDFSFEDGEEQSVWEFAALNGSENDEEHELYIMEKSTDAYQGIYSIHWYSKNYCEFYIKQTIDNLKVGKDYKMSAQIQGGNSQNTVMYIFCNTAEFEQANNIDYSDPNLYKDQANFEYTCEMGVTEWVAWQNPSIPKVTIGESGSVTVGAYIYCEAETKGPWGTMDDFLFNPLDKE